MALVNATLDTLLRFLNWIPLGYIFETDLIDTLIFKVIFIPTIFLVFNLILNTLFVIL